MPAPKDGGTAADSLGTAGTHVAGCMHAHLKDAS